jgi:ribosomal protein S18 acetylase RimI-like enzyme
VADGLGRGGGVGASTVLGTVMLMPWPHGNVVHSPDEAEIRALAVAEQARGSGIGRALVTAVIERAVAWDIRRLLLLTHPDMRAAQHLYAEAGFCRLPDLDWQPGSGRKLLAFSRNLGEG